MARLKWDTDGSRLYETGVRNGVLYPKNKDGSYQNGIVWNGITAITESPSGAEANPMYADSMKYLNLLSNEDFNATLEAYTYPDEFLPCDGVAIQELSTDILIYTSVWDKINMGNFWFLGETFDLVKIGFNDIQGEQLINKLYLTMHLSNDMVVGEVSFEDVYIGNYTRCYVDLREGKAVLYDEIEGTRYETELVGDPSGCVAFNILVEIDGSGTVKGDVKFYDILTVKGPGLSGQPRRGFGLCYRTVLGNDINGNDHSSKIHIIYNALAAPSEKAYATINDSPEAITFSWELTTTPVNITGFKTASHVVLDTSKIESTKLDAILDILYGSDTTEPRLPMPEEIIGILKS